MIVEISPRKGGRMFCRECGREENPGMMFSRPGPSRVSAPVRAQVFLDCLRSPGQAWSSGRPFENLIFGEEDQKQ